MSDTNTTCQWTGASGTPYTYYIYTLPQTFSKCDGNYIYAKHPPGPPGAGWLAVYIGEGDLEERCSEKHHQADCIAEKGATHVHAHKNASEKSRKAEESDLLAGNPEAYEPTGCNVKEGG
jgi:hypothetical protein